MMVAGIILIVVGLLAHVGILFTIGIVVGAVGLGLMLLGHFGRPVAGRNHYY